MYHNAIRKHLPTKKNTLPGNRQGISQFLQTLAELRGKFSARKAFLLR